MAQFIRSKRQKGFTLIELLIVVAIIGIIAALLIPNFLEALQKAKQKRTMADCRNIGNGMLMWITDQAGGAAAGATDKTFALSSWEEGANPCKDLDCMRATLVPAYISELPVNDGWKNPYIYRLEVDQPFDDDVALVGSPGRNGGALDDLNRGPYDPTLYDNDIVWADGFFLRWPEAN